MSEGADRSGKRESSQTQHQPEREQTVQDSADERESHTGTQQGQRAMRLSTQILQLKTIMYESFTAVFAGT